MSDVSELYKPEVWADDEKVRKYVRIGWSMAVGALSLAEVKMNADAVNGWTAQQVADETKVLLGQFLTQNKEALVERAFKIVGEKMGEMARPAAAKEGG